MIITMMTVQKLRKKSATQFKNKFSKKNNKRGGKHLMKRKKYKVDKKFCLGNDY